MKTCSYCRESKPLTDFHILHRARSNWRGPASRCKPCAYLHVRARKFKLSVKQLEELIFNSNGKCASCGDESPLFVDHCHSTGTVRGLLCNNCNLGIGHFRDSPARLTAAAKYLENTK